MPIQPENKVFPHTIPPLPERAGNLKEDFDALYSWIFDQQKALDELNRQVVDKYNLHISGTHAHPKAWAKWRLPRPRYYSATAAGTTVTVPGSAGVPSLFVINGELFEITSDLTCDLSGSGAGGLDTGSIAADTTYYLYGVKSSSTAALVASVTAPSTGPTGYTKWTYLGAFPVGSTSKVFEFTAGDGFMLSNDDMESESHTGDTTPTSKTYGMLPATATKAVMELRIDGDNHDGLITATSTSIATGGLRQRGHTNASLQWGMVNVLTANTLWLRVTNSGATVAGLLMGWVEEPTQYA